MTGTGKVSVTRTGGFAGIRKHAELTLGEDPRTPEVRSLLERIDLSAVSAHDPKPDRFVYTFNVAGKEAVVGEQDLTPELHQLSRLLLDG